MNKRFIKTQLKGVTVHGAKDVGTRTVDLLMGEHSGEYVRGDIMDANAVTQAFDELKGDVDESHDTLEKLETAIAAKQDAGEYAVLNSDDANEDSSLCFSSKVDGDSRIEITPTGIESLNGDSNAVYTTDGGAAMLPYTAFSTSAESCDISIPQYDGKATYIYVVMFAGNAPSVVYDSHTETMSTEHSYIYQYIISGSQNGLKVHFDGEHAAMIYCKYTKTIPT